MFLIFGHLFLGCVVQQIIVIGYAKKWKCLYPCVMLHFVNNMSSSLLQLCRHSISTNMLLRSNLGISLQMDCAMCYHLLSRDIYLTYQLYRKGEHWNSGVTHIINIVVALFKLTNHVSECQTSCCIYHIISRGANFTCLGVLP